MHQCHAQRVTRPKGGINEWLHWLPVSVHKKLDFVLRQLFGYAQLWLAAQGKKPVIVHLQNGGGLGLSTILEADVKKIVTTAKETYEKYKKLTIFVSNHICFTLCFILNSSRSSVLYGGKIVQHDVKLTIHMHLVLIFLVKANHKPSV